MNMAVDAAGLLMLDIGLPPQAQRWACHDITSFGIYVLFAFACQRARGRKKCDLAIFNTDIERGYIGRRDA